MNEITVNIPHTVILTLAENGLCSSFTKLYLSQNEKHTLTSFAAQKYLFDEKKTISF